ncbi:MAG: hypothetical protein JWM05_590 [Acidimicrobiales bacterium]|nr:hypothetical protein [Acidimicrobiales bacterium]
MADKSAGWDVQTLGFGIALGLLGAVMLISRDSPSLRPVHLLGVVILGFGIAVLVAAVGLGRSTGRIGRARGAGPAPLDD